MKCPSCGNNNSSHRELEGGLHTTECAGCGGNWLRSFEYWKWLHAHGPVLEEKLPDAPVEVSDSTQPKTCPECGMLLTKYRVGHGTDFAIERCGICGGIWFDKNEWEALRSRNLHDQVHQIFSAPWQHAIRAREAAEAHELRIRGLLGDEDYEKARQTREWLASHPKRSVVLAYLGR